MVETRDNVRHTKGYDKSYEFFLYDDMLANLPTSGLKVLLNKKEQDIRYIRERYYIGTSDQARSDKEYDDSEDIWKLHIPYDEKVRIYREYKDAQKQYKMISEEINWRTKDEDAISTLEGYNDYNNSMSNFNVDSENYEGYYNRDFTYAASYDKRTIDDDK